MFPNFQSLNISSRSSAYRNGSSRFVQTIGYQRDTYSEYFVSVCPGTFIRFVRKTGIAQTIIYYRCLQTDCFTN